MPLMTLWILFALNYSLSLQSCVCNKTIMFEQHENMYYTWNIQSVSILQFFMFQDLYRNKQFLNKKRIKLQSDIELNRKFAVEINGYHKNATKNKNNTNISKLVAIKLFNFCLKFDNRYFRKFKILYL